LLHYAVIFAVPRVAPGLNPVLRGVASFAVSMGLAWAIYLVIERPCARLRRALID
jgi:peptidoglycan/LPS O-acetylase OafA/YrhL